MISPTTIMTINKVIAKSPKLFFCLISETAFIGISTSIMKRVDTGVCKNEADKAAMRKYTT